MTRLLHGSARRKPRDPSAPAEGYGAQIIRLAVVALALGLRPQLSAQPETEPAPIAVSAEVFDALNATETAPHEAYSVGDVGRIFRAVWWDTSYDENEKTLAKEMNSTRRPLAVTCTDDGRTLSFNKLPAADALRQQRFLLPGNYTPNDSSYFVQAFRNTKYAGLFIGACRVHENAASIMETALNDMINQARFQAKTGGEAVLLKLFTELEAGYRDANPAIQGEFADIVRRLIARYAADPKALPEAVRKAAWLQPPP